MHPVGSHCTDIVFKIADPSGRAVLRRARVRACYLAGIAGSTFARGMDVCMLCVVR